MFTSSEGYSFTGNGYQATPSGYYAVTTQTNGPSTFTTVTNTANPNDASCFAGTNYDYYNTSSNSAPDYSNYIMPDSSAITHAPRIDYKAEAEENRKSGHKEFTNGNYRKALEYFDRGVKYDDDNALIHYWRGRTNQMLGKNTDAANDFSKSIDLVDGNDAEDFLYRGISYYYLERHNACVTDCLKYIKMKSNDANGMAYAFLGFANYALNNYLIALNWFITAKNKGFSNSVMDEKYNKLLTMRTSEERTYAHYSKQFNTCIQNASNCFENKDYNSAIGNVDRALEIGRMNTDTMYFYDSNPYISENEINDACGIKTKAENNRHKEKFDKAFATCKNDFMSPSKIEAIRTAKKAIEIADNPPNGRINPLIEQHHVNLAHYYIAYNHYRLEHFTDAEHHYLLIVGCFVEEFDTFLELGISQFKQHKYNSAKTNLKKALGLNAKESPASCKVDEAREYLAECAIILDTDLAYAIKELDAIKSPNSTTNRLKRTACERQGDKDWNQNNFNNALYYYEKVLPLGGSIHIQRRCGWACWHLNRYTKAKSYFDQTVASHGDSEDYQGRGRANEGLEEYRKAEADYNIAFQKEPERKEIKNDCRRIYTILSQLEQKRKFETAMDDLIRLRITIGALKEAITAGEKALAVLAPDPLKTTNPFIDKTKINDIFIYQAELNCLEQNYEEAERYFLKAHDTNIDTKAEYYRLFGITQFQLKKYSKALKTFQQTLGYDKTRRADIDPLKDSQLDEIHKYIAEAMLNLRKRSDDILAELDLIKTVDEKTNTLRASALQQKANTFWKNQDYQQAAENYAAANNLDETPYRSRRCGWSYIHLKQYDNAKTYFHKTVCSRAKAEDYHGRGKANEGLGLFKEAFRDYKLALEKEANRTNLQTDHDRVEKILKQKKQQAEFETAAKACKTMYSEKKWPETVQAANTALNLLDDPRKNSNPFIKQHVINTVYLYRGWANISLRQYKEAEIDFLQAKDIFPHQHIFHRNIGRVKFALEKYHEAITHLRKANIDDAKKLSSTAEKDKDHQYIADAMLHLNEDPDKVIEELDLIKTNTSKVKELRKQAHIKKVALVLQQADKRANEALDYSKCGYICAYETTLLAAKSTCHEGLELANRLDLEQADIHNQLSAKIEIIDKLIISFRGEDIYDDKTYIDLIDLELTLALGEALEEPYRSIREIFAECEQYIYDIDHNGYSSKHLTVRNPRQIYLIIALQELRNEKLNQKHISRRKLQNNIYVNGLHAKNIRLDPQIVDTYKCCYQILISTTNNKFWHPGVINNDYQTFADADACSDQNESGAATDASENDSEATSEADDTESEQSKIDDVYVNHCVRDYRIDLEYDLKAIKSAINDVDPSYLLSRSSKTILDSLKLAAFATKKTSNLGKKATTTSLDIIAKPREVLGKAHTLFRTKLFKQAPRHLPPTLSVDVKPNSLQLDSLAPTKNSVINCTSRKELLQTAAKLLILKSEQEGRTLIVADIEHHLRLNNSKVKLSDRISELRINKYRVDFELDRREIHHDNRIAKLLDYELIRLGQKPVVESDYIPAAFTYWEALADVTFFKSINAINPIKTAPELPAPSVGCLM